MSTFFSKLFKNHSFDRFHNIVKDINAREQYFHTLTHEDLLKTSKELLIKVQKENKTLQEILPDAFALVRETSMRKLQQRHFDMQCVGGIVLHEGKIAEMMTGEGKTLSATLPAYLNALTGKGVHIVTVNDYLARRDAVWMGQIYHALGLTVTCIVHDAAYRYDPTFDETSLLDTERDMTGNFKVVEQFLRPVTRKEAYAADITYGTNHEFGFDFLRDNLALRLSDRVQRAHHYAIIDEVDSILIDEARTPLIIAAPDQQSSEFYKTFMRVAERLSSEVDYTVDEKLKIVNITDVGIEKVETMMGIKNIFDPEHSRLVHFLQESLKAKTLFHKDKEYVVKNGEVIIVDEFTGRMLQGRRYSGGLHQAIEAKEGVLVKEENRTYAQITIQNYFRLYTKIAGMTGTAQTSAEEFHKVYNLDVVPIPSNKPLIRKDASDVIYKTRIEKYRAIARDVKKRHEHGQPVLLGTTSISNNEFLSSFLQEEGIPHEVLNAKNNEREGAIIAQAGRKGAVTVATNMAGRGVDIILGGNPPNQEDARIVKDYGGLHVIGTERHEARRIDNQLRGRAGRQGDIGSSQFFLSLEDDLVRIFGGDRIKSLMTTLRLPDDTPIESSMVSRAMNQAQQKVEGNNFDIRRHLLDFDDVLNKQRTAIYEKRTRILEAGDANIVLPIITEILTQYIDKNLEMLSHDQNNEESQKRVTVLNEARIKIPNITEPERAVIISQHCVRILDMLWVEHLEHLEGLRDAVNIRAYAQHEPIVEYRREAHILFQQLHNHFDTIIFQTIFPLFTFDLTNIKTNQVVQEKTPLPHASKDIGRNDPCSCGSGKKYKKCHGK